MKGENILAKEGILMNMNKKKFVLYFLLVLMVITVTACTKPESELATATEKEKSVSVWRSYIHEETGASFIYPDEWEVDELDPNVLVMIKCPDAGNITLEVEKHPFLAPAATVQIEENESKLTMNENVLGIGKYKRLDLEELDIFITKAAIVTYEAEILQLGDVFVAQQLVVPYLDSTFYLTCIIDKDEWPAYKDIFNQVLRSFTFVN